MSESSSSANVCPKCGAALPSTATAGLCPRCLMAGAMAPTQDDAEPAAQPPLPPEQIAPHFPQLEILECLGRGGMGVVYKARQKSLGRLVALKLLAPERVRDAKFAGRFEREARALATMNHPNIVTIHDFGQAGGFYYLLMEFVDGMNLRELLRARKLTQEEALTIVPPLCDALQYAHDRGIVHRDIKPENLLLDQTGRVKVADFGIAKMLGTANPNGSPAEPGTPENATQTAVGTPSYCAPEQKTDPQRVDNRADIYSLGIVFYEMLTGELPGKPIAPPSSCPGGIQIDVRLDEVVLRALQTRPELRYQQVSEVKTMVGTILATPTPSNPQPPSQTMNATTSASQKIWPAALLSALVALCLILGVFALVLFLKEKLAHRSAGSGLNAVTMLAPSTGPVKLKLKWPPVGQRIVWDLDATKNGEYLTPGQPDEIENDYHGKRYGLTVLQNTPGGGRELQLEFLRLWDRIIVDGKPVLDYDSGKNPPVAQPIPLTDLYEKVVGTTVRFFLNTDDQVEVMEGIDELQKQLSSIKSPSAPFSRTEFGEASLKQMINAMSGCLPPHAVRPGDTWLFQQQTDMGPLGTVSADYTITFQSWDRRDQRKCARLSFQCDVKAGSIPEPNPDKISATSLGGAISGVSWFDPDLGQGVETVETNDMKIVLNIPANKTENPTNSTPAQITTYHWIETDTIKLEE